VDFNVRDPVTGTPLGFLCFVQLQGNSTRALVRHEDRLFDSFDVHLTDALGNNLIAYFSRTLRFSAGARQVAYIKKFVARGIDMDCRLRYAPGDKWAEYEGRTSLLAHAYDSGATSDWAWDLLLDQSSRDACCPRMGSNYMFGLVHGAKVDLMRRFLDKYGLDACDFSHVDSQGRNLVTLARSHKVPDMIRVCEAAHAVWRAALDTVYRLALEQHLLPPLADMVLACLDGRPGEKHAKHILVEPLPDLRPNA
jgi:hypothetical protein